MKLTFEGHNMPESRSMGWKEPKQQKTLCVYVNREMGAIF